MNEAFKLAPHEWAQLRALLDEALALPVAARAAWLDGLDDRHAPLRPRLAALLVHAQRSDDGEDTAAQLLATLPKVETGQFAPPPGAGEKPGDIVGRHRLIRELGAGGMGSVWLAERVDLMHGRQVALKLPHGAWKRAGLAERMAREREILATLEHPNIARLYDAGVADDGQPWLALEYVEGERIDDWCRQRQLDVKTRLQLFLQVARAVAHAHAQLVVHRDLKPANILVTAAGDVKLLDFGIAKLLAEGVVAETELTREAGRAFTPEYASPEQILGRPLGTASDIYSLGVVLFELLAEVRPYAVSRASRAALEDAVTRGDLPRPSLVAPRSRRRAIRGDLDTIVLKSLKLEPGERYATVAALADDVQRHLQRLPVLAQPDGRWYRLRTFVRRHRVAVGAGSAVGLALIAGAALAVWQARVALQEQRRAEQVKDLIGEIFQDVDPNTRRAGAAVTALDLLANARARLERGAMLDPASHSELLQILGTSYAGLGEFGTAVALSERALELGGDVLPTGDVRLVRARLARAFALHALGRTEPAREELQRVIALLEIRGGEVREPTLLVRARSMLTTFEINEGRPRSDLALDSARRAVQVAADHGVDARASSFAHQVLATAYRWREQYELARDHGRMAYELALEGYDPQGRHVRVLDARNDYGRALARLGQLNEAVRLLEGAARQGAALLGPRDVRLQHYYGTLGNAQLENGQIRDALASLQAGMAADLGDARPSASYLASREVVLGRALLAAARPDLALPHLESAQARLADARPRTGIHAQAELDHAQAVALTGDAPRALALLEPVAERRRKGEAALHPVLRVQALAHRLAGRPQQALALAQQALPAFRGAATRPHATVAAQVALAEALAEIGQAQLAAHDAAAAEAPLTEALQILARTQAAATPLRADLQLALARAHLARGDHAAAREQAGRAAEFWQAFGPDRPQAAEARQLRLDGERAAARRR